MVNYRARLLNTVRHGIASGPMPLLALALLLPLLLAGCDDLPGGPLPLQATTPTAEAARPAPTVDSGAGAVAAAGDEVVTARPAPTTDRANLVFVISDANNQAPLSQATVVIVDSASRRVVGQGTTSSGIYRAALPPGAYDLTIVHNSIPVGGMVRPGIVVEEGMTTTVTSYVAPEATLNVSLRQPDGSPPQQDYVIAVWADGQEASRRSIKALTVETPLTLRTDVVYDLLVEYGDRTVGEEGLVVEEGTNTLSLITPLLERLFQVGLTADGAPLSQPANVAVLDPDNKILFSAGDVTDMVDVVLPTGTQYTVRAQLRDQVIERPVDLDSGPLVPQVLIDFASP